MAHTANLFLFALFCWALVNIHACGKRRFAVAAGLALGMNILVRPTDSIATAAPFLLHLLGRAVQNKRLFQHLCIVAVFGALFVGLTLLYNHQLTGQYVEFPMSKYFREEGLGRFGLGFGADMGTKLHGPEWPGYYPADVIRVSSYRFAELLQDFNGLPLLLVAACVLTGVRNGKSRTEWDTLLMTSALCLVALYSLHFYHGIAFGARHYYLAVPALAIMIAKLLASGIAQGDQSLAYFTKLALVALVLHTLVFPYPRLLLRYGLQYRGASGVVRNSVREQGIANAVVFVDSSRWAWKSAFPLNTYPLDRNSVIFAQHLGERNQLVMEQFSGRKYYLLRVGSGRNRVQIRPISSATGQPGNGGDASASQTGTPPK
jgi:hypothetical protein